MKKTKVGIIGCGDICKAYGVAHKTFRQIDIIGCADIIPEKAKKIEEDFGIKAYEKVEDLLAVDEIEIVINLTVPKVHALVDKQILNAGKHVYSEKPMGVTVDEAKEVMALADSKGLRVGCAPDTFLGAGIQTSIKLIEDGWIGDVFAVNCNMIGGGPDNWHPNPDFFFKPGGGPMLDMGPYYTTALIAMFGPIESVTGVSFNGIKERYLIIPEHRAGDIIKVEVPTHNNTIYHFKNGVKANFTTSFDAKGGTTFAPIEVYGTRGTLLVPDPNSFGEPVKIRIMGQELKEISYADYNYTGYLRGLGVADMAVAIEEGRPHRANGTMALHVLEAMLATYISSDERRTVDLETTCDRPARMPQALPVGIVD